MSASLPALNCSHTCGLYVIFRGHLSIFLSSASRIYSAWQSWRKGTRLKLISVFISFLPKPFNWKLSSFLMWDVLFLPETFFLYHDYIRRWEEVQCSIFAIAVAWTASPSRQWLFYLYILHAAMVDFVQQTVRIACKHYLPTKMHVLNFIKW